MNVESIREGLAAALETIPGLRAEAYIPGQINPPVALVSLGAGELETSDPGTAIELVVLILVAPTETRAAQKKLDSFLGRGTNKSVDDVVTNRRTLPYQGTATVDDCIMVGWDSPASYEHGANTYYGVQLHFQAFVT